MIYDQLNVLIFKLKAGGHLKFKIFRKIKMQNNTIIRFIQDDP